MENRENFYRFSALLLEVGARVLREVFNFHHLGSTTLAAYLTSNKSHLMNLPGNVMRQDQQDTLFPPSGNNAVIEDFDITLMCLLFRNLDTNISSKNRVWSNPLATDLSYQADVGRIRVIRNSLFGHVAAASMDTSTFKFEATNLTTIYHRLVLPLPALPFSATDLQQMIDKELKGPLQPDLDNGINIMRRKLHEWQRYDEDVKQIVKKMKTDIQEIPNIKRGSTLIDERLQSGAELLEINRQLASLNNQSRTFVDKMKQQRIIDISQMMLGQHRSHADKNFVETEGYITGNEKLQQHRRLIITGKSGQGKTYLAKQLLNTIIAADINMKPLILSTVEQWRTMVDSSLRLGIIVDDMCGKFGLNEGELIQWEEESTYMPVLIEEGKHVVIFIMKSHLYEKMALQYKLNAFGQLFSKEISLNLDNINLQPKVKAEFANKYFTKFDLNKDEESELCSMHETFVGFPQLCTAAMLIEEKSKLFDFFSSTHREIILEQIENFCRDGKMIYGCLVLVMLSEGKLSLQSIREFEASNEKKENKVTAVFRSCGVRDMTSLTIQQTLEYLQSTYVSLDDTEESYSFSHDSIEEAVFISHGKKFPNETLLYSSLELICKRLTIKYESKVPEITVDENRLFVPQSYQSILINRFITALKGSNPKNFAIISVANVWSCKDFRKAFIAACTEIYFLADKDENSLLVHAANANSRDLVDQLLEEVDHVPLQKKKQSDQFLTKSAKASCVHKDTSLLKKLCTVGGLDANDILPSAVEQGSIHAIEFLLQSGADINFRSENGENLLHIACLHGRCDIVRFLHSRNANLVNQLDDVNRSVGHYTAWGGSMEILEFLSPLGLDPTCTDSKRWNLLHYACWQGKKDMANHLMDKYPNLLRSKSNDGLSVLHFAAFGGNKDIFKNSYKLLDELLNVDGSASPNETSTSRIKHSMLQTIHKQTVLHLSCRGGCLEMTKYLIQTYPKMLHDLDSRKRTASHHAADSGNIAVLSYLIDHGTDPWCRSSQEETLLHRACLHGQLDMTKYLVKTYPNMLNEVDSSKETAAHHAASSGNVAVLSYLIDRGTDPWCRSSQEETLLHRACLDGQLDMTKYLVETYPNMLNEVDSRKETAAHNAASSGNVAVLSYLIDRGTDPWCGSSQELTLLHRACLDGQLDMTKYLVETYPNMLNEVDSEKRTAAHHAASSGNVAVLSYLIDRGTDPWCRSCQEETLLHRACLHGQLDVTKYLVETYPNMLNEVDSEKRTAAHNAASSGNVVVLSYLIDRGTDPWCRSSQEETLLHRACLDGQLDMTKYLVETYPNMLNEVDSSKETAAHHAASSSNVAVLSYLIDRGTDPWCRSCQEETLLHRACLDGRLDMTKYLVETYPNMLNEVDSEKRTAAHIAASSGNVAELSYLIDRGTDPWCRSCQEETLLHRACLHGQLDMTKYLVETYPNMLNEVDSEKRTAAHNAASSGNVAVLSYLIDRGTDPWCRSSQEETLLHRACLDGQLDMTKYLIETYPNMLNEVDSEKRTAAHNAASSGNVAVLSYLIDRGTDPWCRSCQEETLLHRACLDGQLDMTKYLVETYPNMLNEVDSKKRTAAHNAAVRGNVAVLSYLIDRGTDPWCRSSQEETLLHRACLKGQLDMTKYLVETYPNMLNEVDSSKETAAHNAAVRGNVAVLSYLIDRGTDPWCRSCQKETLLHRACLHGQLDMTKYLVETYPNMLNEVDSEKRTAAHHAASSGNVAVLSYLIDRGTDPWCRSCQEETLLHRACLHGQLDMTKYLVETYPNMLNEVDSKKQTAVHHAASSGNVAVLSYLIDRGTDPWCRSCQEETLLHRACLDGRLDMTKYLVETYPNMLNEVDSEKRTAAHNAASSGNVAVLSYLIDRGTDPWCRSSQEETLLHRACFKGQLDMTKYLVETYPNMLNEVDSEKRTAAHNAASSGNVAVLSYLIDRGTDPWCRSSQEETLLHRACLKGQLDMTKYLVETYPNMLNEVDSEKRTAAHNAASSGNVAVLSYLIDRGTDPWCRSSQEETLLHRACLDGQLDMTKYLVETYPSMLNEVDSEKRTAAHNAAVSGNVAVLSYLIDRGTDPWCRSCQEETLLHRACLKGQLDMTKYLVETYPNMLNEVDSEKQTVAHNAASSGNVAVLSYLIDRGTDPWCRSSQEETLLHRACLHGQLDMTKYLVETYPNMLNEVDTEKRTAAHHAAARGNVAVLSYLIDCDTSVV